MSESCTRARIAEMALSPALSARWASQAPREKRRGGEHGSWDMDSEARETKARPPRLQPLGTNAPAARCSMPWSTTSASDLLDCPGLCRGTGEHPAKHLGRMRRARSAIAPDQLVRVFKHLHP